MAEDNLSHLNYGHAGTATFDTDSRKWSFARDFTTTTLTQIAVSSHNSIAAVAAAIEHPTAPPSTRRTDAATNTKALLRSHPGLVPASDLLPELAVTSAAVVSASETYDPLVGNLYSTGSITCASRSEIWENPRRVAATVTGESRNILRLGFLSKETLGWGDDRSVWIRRQTLKNAESGYWNEEAAPIQQVCFSQSPDRSTLLAVRLPTRTVIFRPFYSQRPRPASRSPYYKLSSSLIDAHPLLSLSIAKTGGSAHVDVAFNPEFQLQFAVVDQDHVWSVWDIDRTRRSDKYSMTCLVQGRIAQQNDADLKGEDGWARILWVGDVNTILVCNRRQISVIEIRGGSFEYLPCPAVVSKRSADWILDVSRHPTIRGQFFVLTSTDLFLMVVITSSDAVDATVGSIGARVLVSWRHYRGTEDFTLSITLQMLDEDNTCIILRSRLNDLMQTYTFRNNLSNFAAPVSSCSPTLLDLVTDGAGRIIQMALEPCIFQGDTSSAAPGLGREYFGRNLHFFNLSVLLSDMSVHEIILYADYAGPNGARRDKEVVELSWITAYRPRKNVRTIEGIREMDGLLQPEGIETIVQPESRLPSQQLIPLEPKATGLAHRVADHRFVYDALIKTDMEPTAGRIDIRTVAAQLKQSLDSSTDHLQQFCGTLLDFAGMEIDVPDVDEASSSLQDLLLSAGQDGTRELLRIAAVSLLHLGDDEQITLASLYDSILQSWVAPLPREISLRIRQRKERMARRIAAEIMLACTRVNHREAEPASNLSKPGWSQDSGVSVPILSSQPLESSPVARPSSQPLPTSRRLQPELQSPLSQTSGPSSSQARSYQPTFFTLADPLVRLSKHLKLKEDAEPQSTIPDSVHQVLRHWDPGADPSNYDWTAAEHADHVEAIDENSQQQLEKARRRKVRREKKQRKEDELAQVQPSSQPFAFAKPTSFPRSSPGPMLGGIGSSSQAPSQVFSQVPLPGTGSRSQTSFNPFAVQSQVEPGKYGGRPDKKKKKKGSSRGSKSSSLALFSSSKRVFLPFPSLQPAFTVRVEIDAPIDVGGQSGSQLAIVPMLSGTVKSEPGFEPKIDGKLHGVGYDYIHNDASGSHMRLDVRSQLKTQDDTILAMYYKGTVAFTPDAKAVLSGSSDAQTTDFGDSFVTFSFETGSEKWKELQNGVYVAMGRFVMGESKGVIVEYKVSRVRA
ncbi:RNA polymerase I-specific transcription-initiation factor-domain-containing protein [Ampelomyces quisqualis]|uniref:RNA polymerase I-specific transcription-initiation factor-domain-containing protein n=1 Tax=Ampelomyces quisqualis TaxID=50730 RepID=A0A6A5QZC3_AMPQU|nr:RNA polymerase I-specific transcription-initiation factor-domain-containing protein [Ampelomyces quisqualis]